MKKEIKQWSMIYVVLSDGTRKSAYHLDQVHVFLQSLAYLKGIHFEWMNHFVLSDIPELSELQDSLYSRTDLLCLRSPKNPRIGRMDFHHIVDASTESRFGAAVAVMKVVDRVQKQFPQYPFAEIDRFWME